jgi:hypothetical protein
MNCRDCNAPDGKTHATNCALVKGSPALADFGIQNEQSDIRAHVGVLAGAVYVYRTADGLKALEQHEGELKVATQPGVNFVTSKGYAVPWQNIPRIRSIPCKKMIAYFDFRESDSTSEKGRKASSVVERLIEAGYFPLPIEPSIVSSVSIQRQGVDLIVSGTWRIQVKCDFRAGSGHARCTGNLFLQVAECNPLKAI